MSNGVFLFSLQKIISPNVAVNRGVNGWRLAFQFDDFNFVKVSTKKIGK